MYIVLVCFLEVELGRLWASMATAWPEICPGFVCSQAVRWNYNQQNWCWNCSLFVARFRTFLVCNIPKELKFVLSPEFQIRCFLSKILHCTFGIKANVTLNSDDLSQFLRNWSKLFQLNLEFWIEVSIFYVCRFSRRFSLLLCISTFWFVSQKLQLNDYSPIRQAVLHLFILRFITVLK